jgi:hypothetical protein
MSLNSEYIQESIETLISEGDGIESQLYDIVLHCDGGVTLSEAKALSFKERNTLMIKINKKIEARTGKEWL